MPRYMVGWDMAGGDDAVVTVVRRYADGAYEVESVFYLNSDGSVRDALGDGAVETEQP